MTGLGTLLEKARLKQGLTIEQVSERTKIRPQYLQAIEDEEFHLLPDQAYVNAFIRTYAKALGLQDQLSAGSQNLALTQGPVKASVKEAVKETIKEPVQEPIEEPVQEPVEAPIEDPVKEPDRVSVTEPTQAAASEAMISDITMSIRERRERVRKARRKRWAIRLLVGLASLLGIGYVIYWFMNP